MPRDTVEIFKEMCDFLFEIVVEEDDPNGPKTRYLNRHIAEWIKPKPQPKPKSVKRDSLKEIKEDSNSSHKEDSNSNSRRSIQKENSNSSSSSSSRRPLPTPPRPRDPPTKFRSCYYCALPLSPEHHTTCEAADAVCRYCGRKGHIKEACGRRGFFPGPTKSYLDRTYRAPAKCRRVAERQ